MSDLNKELNVPEDFSGPFSEDLLIEDVVKFMSEFNQKHSFVHEGHCYIPNFISQCPECLKNDNLEFAGIFCVNLGYCAKIFCMGDLLSEHYYEKDVWSDAIKSSKDWINSMARPKIWSGHKMRNGIYI